MDSEAAPADPAAAPDAPKPGEPAAPAEVTYAFQTPEGGILAPEGPLTEELTALAKANNWSPETAQAVFNLGDKMLRDQQAAVIETVQGWQTELKADKDIGGDKLNENLAVAKRGLEAYADPTFVNFMRESGFLDHPGFVRMMVKVGKAVSEAPVIVPGNGGGNGQGRVPTANVFYGGAS